MHAYNFSIQEAEAVGSKVQGQPELYRRKIKQKNVYTIFILVMNTLRHKAFFGEIDMSFLKVMVLTSEEGKKHVDSCCCLNQDSFLKLSSSQTKALKYPEYGWKTRDRCSWLT